MLLKSVFPAPDRWFLLLLAGLEPSDLASKIVSSESLSGLSALVDEEEEDEELPSILSHQGETSVYPSDTFFTQNRCELLGSVCFSFADELW